MKIGKKEIIKIPLIEIEWSEWMPWNKVKENKEEIPDKSGVYETKHENSEQRLSIGATINLRNRISGPGGLLRGKHSAGQKIRKNEAIHFEYEQFDHEEDTGFGEGFDLRIA